MRTSVRFAALTMLAASFVLSAGIIASAQGRYVGQYSRGDVDNIIRRMEESADEFRRDFYNELDRSNLSGSQKRQYRVQVTDFENATDRLRSRFDSDNSWWSSRNQVRDVVSNARPLNSTMLSINFRRNIERQWNRLRNEVNRVADTYDLPGIAGGGWSGGPWNPGNPGNGGQTSRPPNWAQGTFYSAYPQVTMTIDDDGRVTSNTGRQTFTGRFYRGSIYSDDGGIASVARTSNGIRTFNSTTGQTIDFTRRFGGGGDNDGGWEGPTTTPPNWATGTFYSNDGIRITIERNGRVRSVIGGQTYYGRYYAGNIVTSSQEASITRTNNGIETYNRTTGERIRFRRQ